jgi:hypothetical protein
MGGYGYLTNLDATLVSQLQSDVLRPIFEVNVEFLDGVVRCPAADELSAEVAAIRESVIALDGRARDRLACGPLLVNVAFDDCDKWQGINYRYRRSTGMPQTSLWLPRANAVRLAQSTLLLAWYLLRTYPGISPVLLGVRPPCAAVIRDLSIDAVQDVAKRHSDWIQPRWGAKSLAWTSLMDLVRGPEKSHLGVSAFRALQFLTAHYGR